MSDGLAPAPPLAGRHAFVTGASGGIGRAIAVRLLEAGASVTLAGRNAERLHSAADGLPGTRVHLASGFDVTDAAAVAAGLAEAGARLGPVSILVNNAGEAPSAPFEATDAELWARVLATDLTGVFTVTQAALGDLKRFGTGARIVNIASTAGLVGYRYVSAYCAAKHGVVGLTRALALEFSRSGLTVNAVCPGFTDTPLIARSLEEISVKTGRSPDEARAALVRSNPQGRLVTPLEVAETVLWLVLPASSSITGQSIVVAGGEVMAG